MAENIGSVRQIWRYPVSSLAGQQLVQAKIDPRGLTGDRIGALFAHDTADIVYPGIVRKWNIAPLIAARLTEKAGVQISVDGAIFRDHDDPELNKELESFCGERVIFCPYGQTYRQKTAQQRYAWKPLHLISVQALDHLRSLLPESQVDPARFRPNIVVDLPDLPGQSPEDCLIGHEFSIGNVRLRGIEPSGRCSFTTLAQQNLAEDRSILRALISHFDKNFGIYCEVVEPGDVATGDRVSSTNRLQTRAPIIIVGAGQAGAMTAKMLREQGCADQIKIFGEEQTAPYERPGLSKSAHTKDLQHVLPVDDYGALGIDLHLGSRVIAIDRANRKVETQDGLCHPYHRLVLATGGKPRRPVGADCGFGRVHFLRTAEDASRLHTALASGNSVAVIGSGWLGMELAATARSRNCDVTLFARQNTVLSRTLPPSVTKFILARHRDHGVKFCLSSRPRIKEHRNGVTLTTGTDAQEFDHLIIAIGIIPDDHLARHAGLATKDGILIDEHFTTSDPNIFAIGDVARQITHDMPEGLRLESWHAANDHAFQVARHLNGLPLHPNSLPRFWSNQFDMTIQIAGLPDPAAMPVVPGGGDQQFWDFGSFAVGINRPAEVQHFAARRSDTPAVPPSQQHSEEAQTRFTRRLEIGTVDDFPPDKLHRVEVEGLGAVLVLQMHGVFRATIDRCPHADAPLSEGFIEGNRVVCPIHFAEFDLQSGEAFSAPPGCGNLKCFTVEKDDTNTLHLLC